MDIGNELFGFSKKGKYQKYLDANGVVKFLKKIVAIVEENKDAEVVLSYKHNGPEDYWDYWNSGDSNIDLLLGWHELLLKGYPKINQRALLLITAATKEMSEKNIEKAGKYFSDGIKSVLGRGEFGVCRMSRTYDNSINVARIRDVIPNFKIVKNDHKETKRLIVEVNDLLSIIKDLSKYISMCSVMQKGLTMEKDIYQIDNVMEKYRDALNSIDNTDVLDDLAYFYHGDDNLATEYLAFASDYIDNYIGKHCGVIAKALDAL